MSGAYLAYMECTTLEVKYLQYDPNPKNSKQELPSSKHIFEHELSKSKHILQHELSRSTLEEFKKIINLITYIMVARAKMNRQTLRIAYIWSFLQ